MRAGVGGCRDGCVQLLLLLLKEQAASRTGTVIGAELDATLGADQIELGATDRAGAGLCRDGRAALRAQGLVTGRAFRSLWRNGFATDRALGPKDLAATGAGSLVGKDARVAGRAQAGATGGTGVFPGQKAGATVRTHRPGDNHIADPALNRFSGTAGVCRQGALAGGAALGRAKDPRVTARATPDEKAITIGADLAGGQHLKPAVRTNKVKV